MPISAGAGAAIAGGTGVAGGIIAAAAQGKRDHDARNFALMQGDIEWNRNQQAWNMQNRRDDETWNRQNAYNLELWNMQNKYNSPLEQMRRYKEAGLNPNLIYGQSNTGGSVATANLDSGKIQGGGRPANWVPGPRDYSFIGNALMDALAFREKSVQIDNLEEQNKVLEQEQMLKAATTAGITLNNTMIGVETEGKRLGNKTAEFQLGLMNDLRQTQMDAAKENLRKVQIESDLALNRDAREKATNDMSLREALVRMGVLKAEMHNKTLDAKLKELEILYRGTGPQAGDVLQRIGGGILKEMEDKYKKNGLIQPGSPAEKIQKVFRNY